MRPQDLGVWKPGLLTWAQRTRRQGEALVLHLEFLMTVMREPSPVPPSVRSHSLSPGLTRPRGHSPVSAVTLSGCQAPGYLPRSRERPEAFLPPEQALQGLHVRRGPRASPDEAERGWGWALQACPRRGAIPGGWG